VTEDSGYVAVLNTTLTDDLINEGLAREVVRRIQTLRRDADFNISDKIDIAYTASERLTKAIEQFGEYIRTETLGESLEQAAPTNGFRREDFEIDKEQLSIGVKRTTQ
jgi:isoleucyl-tRNA synthetase